MQFDIITIFPEIFTSYFSKSIIKKAQINKKVTINIHNLRDWALDKHKTVDDNPYGGGAGMILKIDPLYKAVNDISKKNKKKKIILLSAKGKFYNQKKARLYSKYEQLVLICGRYEGVDERVAQHIADEEIAIGEYVLTGGEIPAMTIVDSVTRLLPGVLGNKNSLKEESFNKKGIQEFPQYTRPAVFNDWKVPAVLLSGNHQEIITWKKKNLKKHERKRS